MFSARPIQNLDQEGIDRISCSVLCLSEIGTGADAVIATAIVWDYTKDDVLLLTNYHTWGDSEDFKYCFPPNKQKSSKSRKRKAAGSDDADPVKITIHNGDITNGEFWREFVITADVFM